MQHNEVSYSFQLYLSCLRNITQMNLDLLSEATWKDKRLFLYIVALDRKYLKPLFEVFVRT